MSEGLPDPEEVPEALETKERITAALLGEDVGYTPCVPTFWTGAPEREVVGSLGEEWLILRQYFKLYPTCRWARGGSRTRR